MSKVVRISDEAHAFLAAMGKANHRTLQGTVEWLVDQEQMRQAGTWLPARASGSDTPRKNAAKKRRPRR